MSKLVKQFQRDCKKNPKKVALLALLGIVCVWFWGPLVFPQSDVKRPTPKPTTATTPTAAVAAVADSSTSSASASATIWRWQDLTERLAADPRMKSALPVPKSENDRNPFAPPIVPIDIDAELATIADEVLAEVEPEPEPEPEPVVETPQPSYFEQRTLVLSSTIVGGKRTSAVINGRAFPLGAELGTENGIAMKLISVEPRRAVVEWNGQRRELKILKPGETLEADDAAATGAAFAPSFDLQQTVP
jgi:hypothetical protein